MVKNFIISSAELCELVVEDSMSENDMENINSMDSWGPLTDSELEEEECELEADFGDVLDGAALVKPLTVQEVELQPTSFVTKKRWEAAGQAKNLAV